MQQEDSFFATTVTLPTVFPSTSNYTPYLAIFPEALRDCYLYILESLSTVFTYGAASTWLASGVLSPRTLASS